MKKPSIPFLLIMIIIATALAREYNLESNAFNNPALAAVYGFALLLAFFFLWYGRKKED